MTAAPATAAPLKAAAAAAAATQQNGAGVFQADNVDSEVEQSAAAAAAAAAAPAVSAREALRHSLTVGLSGAGATIFSVATMMWLHTIITYQQRHGTKFGKTCKILWRQGGPRRFYRGVLPSLASAPLCRFGDTLSNELAMVWFHGQQQRSSAGGGDGGRLSAGRGDRADTKLPVWVATFLGSMGAAAFHALVVPLDTYKVGGLARG
ncbi:unnamed protein product [Ectocarpus fasciculatus]